VRFADILIQGKAGSLTKLELYGTMVWIETVLWILPLAMLLATKYHNFGTLLRSAIVTAIAGMLYRFDTYLVGYNPGPGWHYFPSIPEMFISIGLISIELAAYIVLVKRFPILTGASNAR